MTNEQLLTIILSLGGLILTVSLALAGLILAQSRSIRSELREAAPPPTFSPFFGERPLISVNGRIRLH